ncbi:3-deoxy-manno-octulosonate cytidylyltransferase [Microbulbifer variabilis]|uniref:3-deoxy-manno-octulosonate cytidylyltransferase n=1 Tax=Microbulbifer variabilis TaxID=266805 RepID=UPI001CFE1100|nr:3-deoxy-manno-octulosonate cytidylyltransferase [Microbulbifer variabilis]
MNYAVIIPARYKSTRLPGKPLLDICGKPMIRRVWEQCVSAVGEANVYVATDDDRISTCCREFTDNVLMTSDNCKTGTDRVFEAARIIGNLDFVVNVQGDEPLINPDEISCIIEKYMECPGTIVNGMARIGSENEYISNTVPKVAFRADGRLLYMSRAAIPSNKSGNFNTAWKQICIYAFPMKALSEFALMEEKTLFENEEDIEILRFLEMGYDVAMVEVEGNSIAVDTPDDARKVTEILGNNPTYST